MEICKRHKWVDRSDSFNSFNDNSCVRCKVCDISKADYFHKKYLARKKPEINKDRVIKVLCNILCNHDLCVATDNPELGDFIQDCDNASGQSDCVRCWKRWAEYITGRV